jgi:hypothetical protein
LWSSSRTPCTRVKIVLHVVVLLFFARQGTYSSQKKCGMNDPYITTVDSSICIHINVWRDMILRFNMLLWHVRMCLFVLKKKLKKWKLILAQIKSPSWRNVFIFLHNNFNGSTTGQFCYIVETFFLLFCVFPFFHQNILFSPK